MQRIARALAVIILLNTVVTVCAAWSFKSKADGLHIECDQAPCQTSKVSWTKAFYFAVQTVTTVGYGSSLKLDDDGIRRIAILFMVFGATSFTIAIGVVSAFVLEWIRAAQPPSTSGSQPQR